MYCPHCQRSAGDVNELYAMVQSRGKGRQIAFYAIGKNNSPMEAQLYQKRYKVPFTVLPDKDLQISSRFSKVTPPMLIALKKQGGTWQEYYRVSKIEGNAAGIYPNIQP
ncbi:hypothetical protein HW115_13805 [Verrucomicrobiaceae bacterium N1E253]|uniref:Redoxin domain-containing protein n=2 Tax=Oceaniferula marina TaxID=2748318 RepID=A0A851GGN6_9BACT|nr:hypothetical protein [Oceaniferula marina]